ncbi:hypothetical protein [Celeribacter litoreus]|uniref:hypothetical protein n=1 Tax=Celeribacter litoreus TaxID=2876714 RepID=UPI001CCBC72A|nr:hypothetical protein [Celeribacter litoreus]MCA0043671.1 hypothetical protein [Celeribacter litoreus]
MTSIVAKSAFAAALLASAGSAAFAGTNYILPGHAQDTRSEITLDLVRADSDGVVRIYQEHVGAMGALLGSEDVHAGANQDVRIRLTRPGLGDVMAVLVTDGSTGPAATAVVSDD